MSQISYQSEKVAKKKVLLYNNTSADLVIRGGYAVCYDYDEVDITQAYQVTRPETNSLKYFAGVITEEYDGVRIADGASKAIEIYIPTAYGQVVPVWNDENLAAAVATVGPTDGVWTLRSDAAAGNKAARTVQKVNRTTPGIALSRLYGLSDPLG